MSFMFHEPTKSLVMRVDDPFMIRELLPKSKVVDVQDFNIAFKHTMEATKVLRNIGLEIPSPIKMAYNWPGKFSPLDHQKEIAEFHTMSKRHFDLSEMGAMKTAPSLWAADWLMQQGTIKKVLILSPLSILERVWQQEIFDVLMHRRCAIVHGTRDQRREALASDVDFYILNHDGIGINEIVDIIHKRADINLVIVDEGSKFRNPDTQRYRALVKLLRDDMRVWWLTGTPCPTEPTDAWAQARIINPKQVPQFKGTFKRLTMTPVSQFKWVPRPDAYKTAFNALQPAVRYLKKDCIDLPPVVTEDRAATLSHEQKTAFNDMHRHMMMEYEENQKIGKHISAVNAADKINKLRQILCGAVKDPVTEEYVTIPHGPRLKVLTDTIEDAAAKVLIIAPFKGIVRSLGQELKDLGHSVAIVNGDVTMKARNVIFSNFKTGADPHELLCHPTVMAHGLNLTEADMLIFYAPIYSNDEFQQVMERFNRKGQTRKMTIVRIGAHRLEWDIYRVLDGRKSTQNSILALYENIARGLT